MAVNPYTTQAISGFNASPPPDDGSQTSANRVEWAKHIDKIGTPLKNLSEGINSQAVTAINTLALTDFSPLSSTATSAESDWHNGYLLTATVGFTYAAPSGYENGWHNWIFNGSRGGIALSGTGTATTLFRIDGQTASGIEVGAGEGAYVVNTATTYLVFRHRAPSDTELAIAAQMFGG